MSYRAPVGDIAFTLKHAAGLKNALAEGIYGDLDEETVIPFWRKPDDMPAT